MRSVAVRFCGLSSRHGRTPARDFAGSYRCKRPLRTRQLQMGHSTATGIQYTQQSSSDSPLANRLCGYPDKEGIATLIPGRDTNDIDVQPRHRPVAAGARLHVVVVKGWLE